MKAPDVEVKPLETKAIPEDPTARVKRLTEMLRARLTQELSTEGGTSAIKAWSQAED